MPRKKKNTDVVEETVKPMQDDALNQPVDSLINDEVEKPVAEEKTETPIVAEIRNEPKKKVVVTTASKVNVRIAPHGDVLFTVNNGSVVLVEDEHDGWSKITGYVMTDLLK